MDRDFKGAKEQAIRLMTNHLDELKDTFVDDRLIFTLICSHHDHNEADLVLTAAGAGSLQPAIDTINHVIAEGKSRAVMSDAPAQTEPIN